MMISHPSQLRPELSTAEDEHLLQLAARWWEVEDEMLRHKGDIPDEMSESQHAVALTIVATPATSIAGINAKLKIVAYYQFPDSDPTGVDQEMLASTVSDLARIVG